MTGTVDRPASILQKLRNLQATTGKEHQYLLDRFVQERFLYRLSICRHRERFVLKGGLLLTAITDRFYRATRDVDLLASVEKNRETVQRLLTDAIALAVDDGVVFHARELTISGIDAQGERGMRVVIPATIGRSRARLQVDLGFDDLIIRPYESLDYPVLLDEYPPPSIPAYSRESMIAEKLEAIAFLDEASSRLKDYDDVCEVARISRFDLSTLWLAVSTTFTRRGTEIERLWPAVGADRAAAREAAYRAYRVKLNVQGPPQTFTICLDRLSAFVAPLRLYDLHGIRGTWEGEQWTIQ